MCLFPTPNMQFNSRAYKSGLRQFECGACPECLRRRSNVWALRAYYESLEHIDNCMITLTYDNYRRDSNGRVVGELPPDRNLHVCRRDVQLFIKRLRRYFGSNDIKYIACAEYGSRTHRAHYHVILFGVRFPDLTFYKTSKRGNSICKSAILEKLWSHGICTVDSTHINSAVARYCTKYVAKSRGSDTFMLFSHHLGLSGLLRDFNARSYVIEGREYPIPKTVWNLVIYRRYSPYYPTLDYHYKNHNPQLRDCPFADDTAYCISANSRQLFYAVRNSDVSYQRYLSYWSTRANQFEQLLPDVLTRIYNLPDSKYHKYKEAALAVYSLRKRFVPVTAPGSKCVAAYERYLFKHTHLYPDLVKFKNICRYTSCPITANDTKPYYQDPFDLEIYSTLEHFLKINSFKTKIPLKNVQIPLDIS